MQIHSVKITNFLSFKEADFEVSNRGLVLLNGVNRDNIDRSNGSGKSSIVDAIVWGLFGETTKKIKADEVVNRDEFSDCSVCLTLSDDGSEFRVERYRQHIKHKNDVKFFVDGQELKGKNATETQEIINKNLGIDFKIFTNSVLFPQESKFKFVSASDSEKKDILTDILDLNYVDEARERAKDLVRKLTNEIDVMKNDINTHKEAREEFSNETNDLKSKAQSFDQVKEESIQKLQAKIQKLEKSIEVEEKEFEEYQKKFENFDSEQKKSIKQMSSEINDLKDSDHSDIDAVKGKILKYKEKINIIEGLKEKRQELRDKLSNLKSQVSENDMKINMLDTEIKRNIQKSEDFSKMGKGKCPTCLQDVKKDHLDEIKLEYSSQNEQKNIDIKKIRTKNEEISKEIQTVTKKGKELKLLIEKETAIRDKIDECNKIISDSEKAKYKIDTLKKTIKQKKEEKNPYADMVDESRLDENISQIRVEISDIYHEITAKKEEKNPYTDILGKNDAKIKKLDKKINDINKLVEKKREDLAYYEFWKDGFSNHGMKSFIFDAIVNDINDKIQFYINKMFDGSLEVNLTTESQTAKGDVKQKMAFDITYAGEEVSFDSLSGGEKRTISLATDLALSSLISERFFKKFDLLIMDECVDHLDAVGKERFFDLLQTLKKETILVISHDDYFKSKFDEIVTITKKNGESYIGG